MILPNADLYLIPRTDLWSSFTSFCHVPLRSAQLARKGRASPNRPRLGPLQPNSLHQIHHRASHNPDMHTAFGRQPNMFRRITNPPTHQHLREVHIIVQPQVRVDQWVECDEDGVAGCMEFRSERSRV